MTTTLTERWAPEPIQCQPWCQDQDGHPNEIHREDQRCFTADLRVNLTLHKMVEESYYLESEERWVWGPDHIEVNASQSGDERHPHIEIRRESDEAPIVTWQFTTGEAKQLVEALQLILGQVGQ